MLLHVLDSCLHMLGPAGSIQVMQPHKALPTGQYRRVQLPVPAVLLTCLLSKPSAVPGMLSPIHLYQDAMLFQHYVHGLPAGCLHSVLFHCDLAHAR
jgi:hypothetical protein